jgi:hypothetical protein
LEFDVLSKAGSLFGDLQDVDAAPTPAIEAAAVALQQDAKAAIERWRVVAQEVSSLNSELDAAGIEKIKLPQESL